MLYAVIMRFDSLREIEADDNRGQETTASRFKKGSQTQYLVGCNARRSDKFFEEVYIDLYSSVSSV